MWSLWSTADFTITIPVRHTSQARINLLSLPPEVKNRIYELYLDVGEKQRFWMQQPELTRVCHQIRNETRPIYYGQNKFVIAPCELYMLRLFKAIRRDASTKALCGILRSDERWRKAGRRLKAIVSRNQKLIRHLDIRIFAELNDEPPAIFSSLEQNVNEVSLALVNYFKRWKATLHPVTSIVAREQLFDRSRNIRRAFEIVNNLQEPGWKRLRLRLGRE